MHILGPIVDLKKLDWMNGIWIRNLSDEDLIKRLAPFKPEGLTNELLAKIIPLIKDRLVKLADIGKLTSYFYETPVVDQQQLLKQAKMTSAELKEYFSEVIKTLKNIDDWSATSIETALRQLQERLSLKPRPAFMSIRLGLTGAEATPPLFDVMKVLGKDVVLERLQAAVNTL
jgi:glutamyl-tRNA synthetase